MKEPHITKGTIVILIFVSIMLLIGPACTAGMKPKMALPESLSQGTGITSTIANYPVSEGTEYWGLLFAVGVYYNHPDEDRPSMLEAVDDLYSELLSSSYWSTDHIRVIKGSEATGQSLLEGLRWLDSMDDSDDVDVVYITTHGFPLKNQNGLPLDIPPKDEADGADEALVMYMGFENWYSFVWDDLLNLFVSLLDAQGVCLIVDSCFSGGFNDPPYQNIDNSLKGYTAQSFANGLTEDLLGRGRVVLMSTEEHKLSYGSYFSDAFIDALTGLGDVFGNQDGVVSAEEAFAYAQFWVDLLVGSDQHPTISDLYPGELPLTTY
jgi:hypothetical protein